MSNILINLFYGQSVYVLLTKAARSIFVKMYFCAYGDDGVLRDDCECLWPCPIKCIACLFHSFIDYYLRAKILLKKSFLWHLCSVCIRSMDSAKFDMVVATICVVWFLGIIPCNSFGYQNLDFVYIFIGNVNALILPFYSPSYTINASERTHTRVCLARQLVGWLSNS